MAEVLDSSSMFLTAADRKALATYLKSLPPASASAAEVRQNPMILLTCHGFLQVILSTR